MEQKHTILKDWFARYFRGEATETERFIVETAWAATRIDTENGLQKVHARINRRRVSAWTWMQRVAAILFLPLCATLMLLWTKQTPLPEQVQQINVSTNPGMTTSFRLPDSTLVYLNSESSITYPECFDGDIRCVSISGEVYFEVVHNPSKRFIVTTAQQVSIEVLGTHFNVDAYADKEDIVVTLIEGRVNFNYASGQLVKQISLHPQQKAVFNTRRQKLDVYDTSGESEVAWKDGKIVFRNTPMRDVLRVLSKRFNVDFVVRNESLYGDAFTGTFTNQRLERIMEYFKISSHIRWRYVSTSDIDALRSKIEIY